MTPHAKSISRFFRLLSVLWLCALFIPDQQASASIFAPTEAELDAAIERSPQSVPDVRAQPHIRIDGKTYVQMGDMILLAKSYYGIESAFAGVPWTNGIVYYQFDPDVSAQNRQNWHDAAAEWRSAVPALSFEESIGTGNYYIQIHNSTENKSAIGMQGPAQLMNIANWGFRFIIAHEIGHALGLIHEHQRTDRNSFVQINLSNVQSGYEHNFDIWSPPATSYGTYDFDSVMHYHQCAFTICGNICSPSCRTITVNSQYSAWQDFIGQLNHLSELDKAGMAQQYPGMTPVNDQCSGAITLSNRVPQTQSTLNATSTGDPSLTTVCKPSAPISRGVWYKFTPSSNGTVTVSTCGSSFDYDTVLEVYTGNCGARTAITCNDDDGPICSGGGGPASLTFNGTAGTTYLILAASWGSNGAGGNLQIVASSAATPPSIIPVTVTVALQASASGSYVTAEGAGTSALVANRPAEGGWEQFQFFDMHNGNVAIKARVNDRFVTAENAGDLPLIANRSVAFGWEQFQLLDAGSGYVALRSLANNRYVSVNNSGNLLASSDDIGARERFILVVSLIAQANGAFVTAENAGNTPLIANRTAIGGWEQFEVVNTGDGYFALKAKANGKYVCADNAGASPLIANRTAIGGWEQFQWIAGGNGNIAFRALANGLFVTAENAGSSSLIANRQSALGWEQFR